MKKLILLLAASAAWAQPTLTTITDTLYRADSTTVKFNGRIIITWQAFVQNGANVPAGSKTLRVVNGAVSTTLVPNDTMTPSGTTYAVKYDLDFGVDREVSWTVPTSGSPVTIAAIEGAAAGTITAPAGIVSLNGLTPATQLFARVNDTNVTLSWGSATSTHTLTAGWTGQLAVARGGSGAATLTGILKGNGTSAFSAATATDLLSMTSWPSGLDLTELGYVNGVTSAIQTQLDTKVGTASNLTTAGAVPYVSASGTLNQDASQFFWDASNNRLGIGTATPGMMLDLVDGQAKFTTASGFSGGKGSVQTTANNSRGGIQLLSSAGASVAEFVEDPAYGWRLSSAENVALNFGVNSTTAGGFAATTSNLLIGGTTDGNYKLDVQKSGSAGTFRCWDQLATTGSTNCAFRAGEGQTGPVVDVINFSGTRVAGMYADGTVNASLLNVWETSGYTNKIVLGNTAGYMADIQKSGSSGTLRVYDQTAVTGLTKALIRAGAADDISTKLLSVVQNDGTTDMFWIDGIGDVVSKNAGFVLQDAAGLASLAFQGNGATPAMSIGSGRGITWSSTTYFADTKDLGLSRNAAGVVEVNNGTPGTYRDLRARNVILTTSTPASAAATGVEGTIAWDSSYLYVATGTNTWKRVAIATW